MLDARGVRLDGVLELPLMLCLLNTSSVSLGGMAPFYEHADFSLTLSFTSMLISLVLLFRGLKMPCGLLPQCGVTCLDTDCAEWYDWEWAEET